MNRTILNLTRIGIGVLMAFIISLVSWKLIKEYLLIEEYASFTSPDGRYCVVVQRIPNFFLMPGQAGDAPGKVVLYRANGQLLQETTVDMVQLVGQVRWTEDRVQIKLIADWALPD